MAPIYCSPGVDPLVAGTVIASIASGAIGVVEADVKLSSKASEGSMFKSDVLTTRSISMVGSGRMADPRSVPQPDFEAWVAVGSHWYEVHPERTRSPRASMV